MPTSMTGFGRAELVKENWQIVIEAKSVNSRYLDINLRFPGNFTRIEDTIRQRIKQRFTRGRIEIFLDVEELGEQHRMVKIDRGLLRGYLEEWTSLQEEFPGQIGIRPLTLSEIIRIPDIVQVSAPIVDWSYLTKLIMEALDLALDELSEMRRSEGASLTADMIVKLDRIKSMVADIALIAPQVPIGYARRLQERLSELLEGTSLNEERFNTEVAIFADRCSVDEEIVRLNSHIAQFHHSLALDVPVGRKLDFLIQEMNREVNTIGSKANNVDIATLVVEIKSELERLREQVQNLE